MPFARTYADTFEKRVRAAADRDKIEGKGDGQTVTLESLRAVFITEAWADLKKDDSRITKLVSSDVFKNKKGKNKIWADYLILFGILNCAGDAKAKSIALYSVL